MPFEISITVEAESQLHALPVREQRILEAAILSRLTDQPTTTTRAVKRLRPNPFAEYELRVGDFRVLYNVEESRVVLLIVGRKVGNKLIVGREEFHGHQDHSAEPTGDGPDRDVE
jgi:mRNA-degrading endonuclease RelE of RelBE toxin-antitoxin system